MKNKVMAGCLAGLSLGSGGRFGSSSSSSGVIGSDTNFLSDSCLLSTLALLAFPHATT